MKSVLSIIGRVSAIIGGVLAILGAITLCAWVSWQVLPQNPYQNEWRWNVPDFRLAIAVWFAGIPLFIVVTFTLIVIGAIVGEKFRKTPP